MVLGALPERQPRSLPTTPQVLVYIWEEPCWSCSRALLGSSIPGGFTAQSQSKAGTAPGPCAGMWHCGGTPRAAGHKGLEGSGVRDCPAARSLVATAAAVPTLQKGTFVSSRRSGQLWPGSSAAAGSSRGRELRGGHASIPRGDAGWHLKRHG